MTFKPHANGVPGEISISIAEVLDMYNETQETLLPEAITKIYLEHGRGAAVSVGLTDRIVIPVVQHGDGTFGPIS